MPREALYWKVVRSKQNYRRLPSDSSFHIRHPELTVLMLQIAISSSIHGDVRNLFIFS